MLINKRFWTKVKKTDSCWLWTAKLSRGYGRFWFEGRTLQAHRISYELIVGPIAAGLELDHTCHNADKSCLGGKTCQHRRCVNPAHLEPVTHRENNKRGKTGQKTGAQHRSKTHCPQGHVYDKKNTYVTPNGRRNCRECRGEAMRTWYQLNKALAT